MINPMPVTVQPGVSALLALIRSDPEFAVDVKKGILAQVVQKLMPKSIEELHLRIIKEEVDKARGALIKDLGREGKTINDVVQDQIKQAADAIRSSYYAKALDGDRFKAVKEAIEQQITAAVRVECNRAINGDGDNDRTALRAAIEKRVQDMMALVDGAIGEKVEAMVNQHVEVEIHRRVEERLAKIRAALA